MNRNKTAFVLLFVILAALSCGQNEDAAPAQVVAPAEAEPANLKPRTVYAPAPYSGSSTLQERIATADVIAIVRLLSVEAVVEGFEQTAWKGESTPDEEYAGVLKFTFDVQETLKSDTTLPGRIKAFVASLEGFPTQAEAREVANKMLVTHNNRWHDRDAVVFLLNESTQFPSTSATDTFFMSLLDFVFGLGDVYSLASKRNKIWLPSAYPRNAQVAGELRFLLDVPDENAAGVTSSGSSMQSGHQEPSITLSAFKTKVAEIETMTAGQSQAYEICIASKYLREREERHQAASGKMVKYEPTETAEIGSGLARGAVVFEETIESEITDTWKSKVWFEGPDADLFMKGDVTGEWPKLTSLSNSFYATGGKFFIDVKRVRRPWVTVRPLPVGTYRMTWNLQAPIYVPCNDTGGIFRLPTIVTVAAPSGTLHEALFDPVTDGSAIAANSSNGILKPASFTDANNASASLQRIEWASDTVKVKVSPHTGLAGHKLDFIELDGSVSLSLAVDDATVDAANMTLSWSVNPQPWHDGDLLMLRIAEVVPEVALVNVPATITQGQTASVTVRATDLSSSNSYTVRLAANSFAIGFNNSCSYGSKTVVVPSGSASHSATIPLQGCDATSSTVTATLMQGTSTVATATAEVEVEASSNVTVTLSPREERHGTYTNMTVQWNDPGGCVGRYYVGIFNSQQTVVNNLGYHPAPATTSLSQNLGRSWDDIPNLDWFVKVRCHSSSSRMTIVGQASLQSGLPSTP